MKRLYIVVGAVLLVGLVVLGAGLTPLAGCERSYAVAVTERTGGAAPDAVANASVLPDDVGNATDRAAETGEPVSMSQADYRTYLDGRAIRVDGVVYEHELVVTEGCGGALEDAFLVVGVALTTLGALGLPLLVLYRGGRPPMNVLHYVAVVGLVLGAATFAAGVAAPAGCTDNFALETRALQDADASEASVVDAVSLPLELQETVERSVETNRTAFVDRDAYREHVENRNVRYEDEVYDADIVLVQDCGGGVDDALLVVGLLIATVAAVGLSLLVLLDHGRKVL